LPSSRFIHPSSAPRLSVLSIRLSCQREETSTGDDIFPEV